MNGQKHTIYIYIYHIGTNRYYIKKKETGLSEPIYAYLQFSSFEMVWRYLGTIAETPGAMLHRAEGSNILKR